MYNIVFQATWSKQFINYCPTIFLKQMFMTRTKQFINYFSTIFVKQMFMRRPKQFTNYCPTIFVKQMFMTRPKQFTNYCPTIFVKQMFVSCSNNLSTIVRHSLSNKFIRHGQNYLHILVQQILVKQILLTCSKQF